MQDLTASQLVFKTIQLARNCQEFADILNARILKQMSVFLRELSNDNSYVKALSLENFSELVENADVFTVNDENVDFYWNLLEFHFNVTMEKEGSVGVFARLDFYLGKINSLLSASAQATDPVTFFKANFLSKYKLADMFQQQQASNVISEEEFKGSAANAIGENEEADEEIMEGADDEDQVAKSEPQFRTWLANLQAQTNCMRILLKIADYLDTSRNCDDDDDEDEDFEDCDDDDDRGMEDENG